jgi:iron complex transport system substrate-binding protein
MMHRSLTIVAALLMVSAAACGSEPAAVTATTTVAPIATTATSSTIASPATFPVVVTSDLGSTTIAASPRRIAALSATHVEMLFAIGAGDQVIAGDLYSNHPAEAAELTLVDSFNLNLEALIDHDPDLVILSFDPGEAVTALNAVGIPTLLFGTPLDLDGVYDQIETLGMATGHVAEAAGLRVEMEAAVAATVAAVGQAGAGITYYHETDPFSFYTPNSKSFIGTLYALLGMENIADEAADALGSGFPQLSPEYIIAADPAIIFLGGGFEDEASVAARDGWDTMTAVADGQVVVLDYDMASRWGPRVPELLEDIAEGLLSYLQESAG